MTTTPLDDETTPVTDDMFGDPVQIGTQTVYPCTACSTATSVITVPEAELENHRAGHAPASDDARHTHVFASEAPAAPPTLPVPDAEEVSRKALAAARLRRSRIVTGIVLAVAVIVIVVIVAVVKHTAKMSVDGTFDFSGDHASDCSGGEGGYDDINDNTQVTINADGRVLAVTSLGSATVGANDCLYSFTLDGVSKNHDIYTVEVGHRGGITFTKAEVETGDVGVTLG